MNLRNPFLARSELQWGTSAAGKFKLQALVAPRKIRFFLSVFLGLEYFAQRFNQPFDKSGQKKFFDPLFDPPGDVFGQKKGL